MGVPEKEKRDNGAEQTLEEIRLNISHVMKTHNQLIQEIRPAPSRKYWRAN